MKVMVELNNYNGNSDGARDVTWEGDSGYGFELHDLVLDRRLPVRGYGP